MRSLEVGKSMFAPCAVIVCVLGILCSVSGCQSGPVTESSPYFDAPPGSTLEMLKPVEIPANSWHVDFQGGEVSEANAVALYRPFCKLHIESNASGPQTVSPQLIQITGMSHYQRIPAAAFASVNRGIQIASLQVTLGGGRDMDYITEIQLGGKTSPAVNRLICHNVDDALTGTYLTLAQINVVLGQYARIQVAGSGAG
ncbi:MAG: hypothetical protein LJE91_03525 [Gammaproteobacteria bacterium]|nr:hypothetical protein [Gammaproteobacteria bacterium]